MKHPSFNGPWNANTPRTAAYRAFIAEAALRPGLRLFHARRRLRSDWPFLDTKFNPNTGRDLGVEAADRIFCWVLGRGVEAVGAHLAVLDRLGFDAAAEAGMRTYFSERLENTTAMIRRIRDRFKGRCPFAVNRRMEPIDLHGQPIPFDAGLTGAADVFCAKALLSHADAAIRKEGVSMLLASAEKVRAGRFGTEQFGRPPGRSIGQGMRMLFLDAPRLVRNEPDAEIRQPIFDLAHDFIHAILDRHYDPEQVRFSESVDRETGAPGRRMDPGHGLEFVGLGLSAALAMKKWHALERATEQRIAGTFARLFLEAFGKGFNPKLQGIYKEVDNVTGEPTNTDMPWWPLPEAMRAAAHLLFPQPEAGEPAVPAILSLSQRQEEKVLNAFIRCHEAYFTRYLNPDLDGFPYQTRCGETGRVLDKPPAVPEADPLYHSNLSFLDLLRLYG